MLLSFAATTVLAFFIAYADQMATLQVFVLLTLIVFIVLKIGGITNPLLQKRALFYAFVFFLALFYFEARDPSFDSKTSSAEENREITILSYKKRKLDDYLLVESSEEGRIWKTRYLVNLSDLRIAGGSFGNIRLGDRYIGTFTPKPFGGGGLLGDFDEQVYYYAQGVTGLLEVHQAQPLEKGKDYEQLPLLAQDWLESRTEDLNQESRDFIHRVFLGKGMDIDDSSFEKQLKGLGVSHLLAASGLHVNILISWGMYVFSKLRIKRIYGDVLLFGLLGFYAWLLQFPASIMRALIFAAFWEAALLSFRRLSYLNRIVYSLFLILLIQPYAIGSVGLQLSFLCAIAIDMQGRLNQRRPLSGTLVKSLRLTFWINCLTLPVLAGMTGSFPLATFIANLLLVPFFTILFSLGLLIILVSSNPFFALLLPLFELGLSTFSLVVAGLEKLSLGSISNLYFLTGEGVVIYYFFIALVFFWRSGSLPDFWQRKAKEDLLVQQRHRQINQRLLLACLLLLVTNNVIFTNLPRAISLTMINVGQGDSFLLETPHANLLFDTGGRYSFKEYKNVQGDKLAQTLKSWGVSRLDAVFLSHGDYDHVGNLESLVASLDVGSIYVSPLKDGKLPYEDLPVNARPKLIPYKEGARMNWAGVYVTVLQAGFFDGRDANEDSAVLLVEGDFSVLFMADAEKAERRWIGDNRVRNIDVLKLAHHGSEGGSSTAFLEWTNPKLALISAGYENRYGHPHEEVMARLAEMKIPIARTDVEGSQTIFIAGRTGQITHKKRQAALWANLSLSNLGVVGTGLVGSVVLLLYYRKLLIRD